MGKTNVLDAVYYLCLGKSHFSGTDRAVVSWGTDVFRLEGVFSSDELLLDKVVVKCKLYNKKEIEISGVKTDTISAHVGRFPCVIMAPDDIHLMLDGSEERRQFINNTLVQSNAQYLQDLMTYTALLKRRNALLKSFAEQRTFDALLLESISAGMFAPAARIHDVRIQLIQQLVPLFNEAYAAISGNRESCDIVYKSQLTDGSLVELMKQHLDRDRALGRTSQGIHKDDLLFTMNDEPLKNFASQGQLKSFVLALKIAQYRLLSMYTARKPLFLLDDVFDKLDPLRVQQLLRLLMGHEFGQIFITDTNGPRMQDVVGALEAPHTHFSVKEGFIESILESLSEL
jgi:DNA replication and repair protein RecF